jgi:mono/diheme cytochrome c family protein
MNKFIAIIISSIVLILILFNNFAHEKPIDEINEKIEFRTQDIEKGAQLALIGDCATCHTKSGGEKYSGGVPLPTPFGTIYSTNITPDDKTGIGTWSFEAFKRSMREGVDRDGKHLYPAFPYDYFSKTSDADLEYLYAFLMSLPPVQMEPHPNELKFPFSIRELLAGWKMLFLDDKKFEPDPSMSDEENRGAYLVSSLGHCGACHSPRNILGAVIRSKELNGGEAEGWVAPAIGNASSSKVSWTIDDYADYLFDGWSEAHGIAGGPMTPVVDNLYDANEDDVFAIATWLAAVTPSQEKSKRDDLLKEASILDWPAVPGSIFDEVIIDDDLKFGQEIFSSSCAKCHKERISDKQPVSLALSTAINATKPTNFLNIVRYGIEPPYGSTSRKMQPIELTDEQLIALSKYVRFHFANKKPWDNLAKEVKASAKNISTNSH